MPELPEVEHVRRGLEDVIVGRRLLQFEASRKDLRWPIPKTALGRAVGCRVEAVRRRGKWLAIDFDGAGGSALVHLGMSGRVLVAARARDWELHEHWRMRFRGSTLRGIDPRRFGALLHSPTRDIDRHPRLAGVGPEPLDPRLTSDELHARAARKRVALKAFLLDGRNLAGVGNIYASEACFLAGLRPGRSVARIRRKQWARLLEAVRTTLEKAIASGGTSLRDYVDSDGNSGTHQYELHVYGREGEACRQCDSEIRSIRQSGRSTYYCPTCQQ